MAGQTTTSKAHISRETLGEGRSRPVPERSRLGFMVLEMGFYRGQCAKSGLSTGGLPTSEGACRSRRPAKPNVAHATVCA